MKKIVVLLCCTVILLCGCGKEKETAKKVQGKDLKQLETAMLKADTTLPEMVTVRGSDKDAELNFTALSDLEYDRISDYFYAYAKDGSAEEIAVVKLKDEVDVAPMMDSINQHLKDRKGSLQEYAPDQVGLVDQAVVTYEGNDVVMIVSKKSGLVQKEFKGNTEKDK